MVRHELRHRRPVRVGEPSLLDAAPVEPVFRPQM